MAPLDRVSPFWRFQIAGWLLLAVGSFPLKLMAYGTPQAAFVITITREPLGLLLSSGLHWLYQRLAARGVSHVPLGATIVGVCLALGALDTLIGRAISAAVGRPEELTVSYGIMGYRSMLYAAWSVLYFWIKAQRAARVRELSLAHAQTARREAELQLLRAQINPHFLFNALNTILATLEANQARPKVVVEGLAAYLRYSLQHRHDSTVPLGAEYDAVINYLAVEQARFQGELTTDCAMDPALRDIPVPGVLIQPLVENAVKYSRETSEPPHQVRLRVNAPEANTIEIEVANTGTWLEPNTTPGPHGTGLENLRRRLALLYPDAHRLETTSRDGWVHAKLSIAARRMPNRRMLECSSPTA